MSSPAPIAATATVSTRTSAGPRCGPWPKALGWRVNSSGREAAELLQAPEAAGRGRERGRCASSPGRTLRIIARRDHMQTPGAVGQDPGTPQKGPRVWLDMDQAELDAAYTQSVWAPNREQLVARHRSNSAIARTYLGAPQRYAYGATPIEALDVYRTTHPGAPIHIFIHGGAWRGDLATHSAFAAELFVNAGAHFVVPDFAWVQDVGGSLLPMAAQVRRAVAWVYGHAQYFGSDPQRIYVSGHSSGRYLAGLLVSKRARACGIGPALGIRGMRVYEPPSIWRP